MSIQNYLNQIKNAIFGREVRQSIHDAIKQCYDDASINHDNANMEVKLARGTHETLNNRLDENDKKQESFSTQLAEIENKKANEIDLEVERERINEMQMIPEGGTTSDVALNDIKIGVDGRKYDTPGEAVRGQMNDVNIILKRSVDDNYDYAKLKPPYTGTGYKIDTSTGIYISDPNYNFYRYSITPGDIIKVKSNYVFQFQSGENFPTNSASSNRVGKTYGTFDGIIVAPSKAVCLVINKLTTDTESGLYKLEPISEYEKRVYTSIKEALSETASSKALIGALTTGKYIGTDLSVVSIGNTNFQVRTYEVNYGDIVFLKGEAYLQGTSYPLAVFGASSTKGSITIIDGSKAGAMCSYSVRYEAPEHGYIIVASYLGHGEVVVYPNKYIPKVVKENSNIKLQVFGDSITDNSINTWDGHITWLDYISNFLDELNLTNSSYGGAALTNQNEYSVVNRVQELLNKDSDVITVWAGTNDWSGSMCEIGDLTSGTNTIVGAVKKIIEYITTNSNSILIFATPLQRYNSTDETRDTNSEGTPINAKGQTLRQVCDAILDTCKYYGVPCIDLNAESGYNRINIGRVANDGLHPSNMQANKRIAKLFAEAINKYTLTN